MPSVPYWRLSGFYFFYFAFVGAMAPYWGLYLQSLDFSAFQIGVLMSPLHVMRVFAPNVWGHIADRTGRRGLIVQVAAIACALSFIGVFVDSSFWWMFAVMSLIGFFWSAPLPLVEAITLSHLGERTDGYGRVRLWGSVGFILAVVGLGMLLDYAPVRAILWAIMGVLLGIVLFARMIPEAEAREAKSEHVPLRAVLRRGEVLALLIASLLLSAAHGPYYTFFTIHLVEHGYSKTAAGWLWALGVICEIGVFLVMPQVFRLVRVETALLVSLLAAVLRFALIGTLTDDVSALLFAQVLHALTFGVYHASAIALVHRHFQGRNQARGQALYNSLAYGVGGTLGSLYAGSAWGVLGGAATFAGAAVVALLAAAVFGLRGQACPCIRRGSPTQ